MKKQMIKIFIPFLLTVFITIACNKKEEEVKVDEDKVDLLSDNWPGWALSYSGYREGQDPQKKIFPSQTEVLEDLKIIENHWKIIRTYGADQHLIDVLEVIKRENIDLKVMLGIWMDGEPEYVEDNLNQLKLGIELANKYKDIVIAVNVGNESQVHWSDHKVPQDQLVKYINEVKEKVSVPVTTADTWDYWADLENSSKVIDAVDFIAAHIYPIWGKVDIDRAMEVTKNTYENLKTAIPNKKIIITEAGWASYTEGELHAPEAGDEIKQKKYFNDLMKWSQENNVIVFNFSAFDESWKGTGTEGHWGLFSEKRKAKLVMQELYPDLMPDGPTSPGYE
jgi:exo-beta-1,3-glucanase (GH17 family)